MSLNGSLHSERSLIRSAAGEALNVSNQYLLFFSVAAEIVSCRMSQCIESENRSSCTRRSIFDVNISKLGLHYKRLGHVCRTPVRPVLVLRFLACQFFMTRFLNLRINRYFENEKLPYRLSNKWM